MSDSDNMELVNKCWVVECVTNAGVFNHNDLPGPSLSEWLESDSESDPQSLNLDGFSQGRLCGSSIDF